MFKHDTHWGLPLQLPDWVEERWAGRARHTRLAPLLGAMPKALRAHEEPINFACTFPLMDEVPTMPTQSRGHWHPAMSGQSVRTA
jgi:hypothetical protein